MNSSARRLASPVRTYLESAGTPYPVEIVQRTYPTRPLDEETCEWLRRFRVVRSTAEEDTLLRIETGKLAAYAFHYADRGLVRLCSDLIAWLFLFDDHHADGVHRRDGAALARRHGELEPVLAGALTSPVVDPFAASLAELYGRLAARAPARWLRRLSGSIRRYFEGCEIEAGLRERRETPRVEEYLSYRDKSIGVYPMLDLIELAGGAYLPDELAASPDVAEAKRLANLVLAVVNDLFSCIKESREDESFNLVMVAARAEDLPMRMALLEAARVHDHLLRLFDEHCRTRLGDLASRHAELGRFLSGIRSWFQGNYEWSSEVLRYNDVPLDGWEFLRSAQPAPGG